jgi:GNAT superfamily N-acetyltransferase
MTNRPINYAAVVCRPALPKDTADVMELTRTIWQGEDYVPHVWAEWLADPEGLLAVAEYAGRAIGLSKLTRLGPNEWWLEGLRVHPGFEGRGVASRLHDYLVGYWERSCSGVIRLATASFRKPVQHLCERSGFRKVGEYTQYAADPPAPAGGPPDFRPLALPEAPEAVEFARRSPALPLAYGLMDLGWQWAAPGAVHFEASARRGLAWWWRDRRGLLVAGEDDEAGVVAIVVQLLTCPPGELAACLQDFRQLAGSLGYTRAGWTASLHPELTPLLAAAGFQRAWDASIYVYEKDHPAGNDRIRSSDSIAPAEPA